MPILLDPPEGSPTFWSILTVSFSAFRGEIGDYAWRGFFVPMFWMFGAVIWFTIVLGGLDLSWSLSTSATGHITDRAFVTCLFGWTLIGISVPITVFCLKFKRQPS
jgi:hypothetical protein